MHQIKIYQNSSKYAVKYRLYDSKACNYACILKKKKEIEASYVNRMELIVSY